MTESDKFDRDHPAADFASLSLDLGQVLEKIPGAVVVTNRTGDVIFCNRSAEILLGDTRRNLLHRPFPTSPGRLHPPIDLTPVLRHGQTLERASCTFTPPDGSEKSLSLRIAPLLDPNHQVAGALIDIQDGDRAEKTHGPKDNLLTELHATIRAIADAVVIYRPNGEIVHMNPAAKRMLGYQEADFSKPIGERLVKFRVETPDGDPFPVEQTLRRMLAGEAFTGLIAVVRRDQSNPLWISLSGAPIFSPRGEVVAAVGTGTDITALHCADEERSHCMQMLTHDLRSPLTVIHGHAQLLETRLKSAPDDELQLHIRAIQEASQHMSTMLGDLLEMASIEGGKYSRHKEAVPLGSFLKRFLDIHCMALDCDRVTLELPAHPPTLEVNPNALERILLNLLSNALKYSPPDKKVRLRLTGEKHEARFAVIDQGCGIAPEHIPLLFRRFVRIPGAHRPDSLGLGLYITRLLVESQGGEISVTSTPGQGSTFSVSFPVPSA